MNAELVCVGTELLLGHTVNTDATILARELAGIGVGLRYVQTVGDNPERLEAALREALSRADLVITTGGLGPTDDDLTKNVTSRVAGRPLVIHEPSLARLEAFFAGRPMGMTQRRQVMLPEGCDVFVNNHGTAPGCAFTTRALVAVQEKAAQGAALASGAQIGPCADRAAQGCPVPEGRAVIMLPGPPSELTPMLRESAVPWILRRLDAEGPCVILSRMVRVFGQGEGSIAEALADLTAAANPTTATYAADHEVLVRVTARARQRAEAEALCDPVVARIRERLGDVVYGVDVDSLEQCVVAGLARRGLSLALAESCTGGLVAQRITDVPGASGVFGMGIVAYANEIKTRLLDVPETLLATHGAVSQAVAEAMAQGARRAGKADLGLGITGLAGPDGGSPEKPVGLVYLALADASGVHTRTLTPGGLTRTRNWIRQRSACVALDMVRRYLEGR